MSDIEFPVLMHDYERRKFPACPRSVPWGFVEPHRAQAMTNHGQTTQRLAERGGLGPSELWAVVNGKHWHEVPWRGAHGETQEAVDWLNAAVAEWLAAQRKATP